jgi:hypothetical protein
MPDSDKHTDLVGQLQSPGWRLLPHKDGGQPVEGTLEHVVRTAHARKQSGYQPGLVRRLENEIELDLFDLEQLWWHLGLPT